MQVSDLIALLGVSLDSSHQLTLYEARLEAAKDYVKGYCRNNFLNASGKEEIPKGAQMGIALLVKSMGETQNVQSQSLGDMSKSFFEGATGREAKRYLKPYVRVVV